MVRLFHLFASSKRPHYHLVLPLAEKVPASLWRVVWQELHDRIGLVGDPQTKDPARIFYLKWVRHTQSS